LLPTDVAGQYNSIVSKIADDLDGDAGLRAQIEELAQNVGPQNAKSAAVVFDGYTALITQLLDADQKSGARVDDATMRSGVELLNALNRQTELESQIVVKGVLAGLADDPVEALEVQRLAALQAQGERDLAVRTDGAYENDIRRAVDNKVRTDAVAKLQALAGKPLDARAGGWLALPPDLRLLRTGISNVGGTVSERSTELSASSQDEQRNLIAVTIGSVLLAIVLLWLTNRWITRPLQSLADQASAMANETLPHAVREILDTPPGHEVVAPEITPVRVRAGGEVRDVEVALNQVQDSALALAVEQAQLRGNVADAFVNLGRRNQNLLSRQLEFITHLENDESDPETLEHLFRLDHLATRMRRNAESLLVLAGHEPARTWTAPVEIGDVVRGALGEVEGYQRVRLPHMDDARVDGAAAVDVSHVIAELVENALAFSPPDSDVEVYGRMDEAGYVITIVDQGIGMPAEDLARANATISSADARTFAPSRFLGHYVVAQLAARHNLRVYLADSPAGGLTASVLLPPVLVGGEAEPPPVAPQAAEADIERPVLALPRRESSEPSPEELAPLLEVVLPEPATAPEPVPALEAEPDPFIAFALESRAEPEPEPEAELAQEFEPEPPPAPEAPARPAAAAFAALADVSRAEVPPPLPEREPAPEPAPVAEVEVAPEPVSAPTEPPKPRIGVGTFADLRTAPETPAPRPAPGPEPVVETSELDAPAPPPDRAGTFAEVATAVDAVTTNTTPPGEPPPATFAEDLLPQKLPKRGRKGKKEMTWKREKPATPAVAPAPVEVAPPPSPIAPAASHVVAAPLSHGAEPTEPGAVWFPPGGPSFAQPAPGAEVQEQAAETPAAQESDQRFAFFAAFRDASHRAREEAGIDDRRGA
jgi:signal transduction histidine kinase